MDSHVCIICLESNPPPIQSGCACRSDCGLAHVACLIEKAVSQQAQRGHVVWWACQTCNQHFTGAMQIGLAEAWWSRVCDQAEESEERLFATNNLADSRLGDGKHAEAEQIYRELLGVMERVFGKEHPATLTTANNLSTSFYNQGNPAGAERISREIFDVQRRILGKEHPDTLRTASNLAVFLSEQGNYVEAERIKRQVLAARKKVLGKDHPSTLTAAANLAATLSDQGKHEEAEEMLQTTVDTLRRVLGNAHPQTLAFVRSLDNVRSAMRAKHATEGKGGGKAAAQRNYAAAPWVAAYRAVAFMAVYAFCYVIYHRIFENSQDLVSPLFLLIWIGWRTWAFNSKSTNSVARN
jgi:tetratricopeptide (TPR) repeat protein